MMATLPENTVYIHLLQPDAPSYSNVDNSILSGEEIQRLVAFRFQRDRELYRAAHLFLRQVLSRYAPLAPAQWQFSRNAYGKPAIANPDYTDLRFNLSHTHGLIACAVTQRYAIGVDVETIKPLIDLPALCQYAFTTDEAADVLAKASHPQQTDRFYRYWTLKEAYIKARGMGLSLPLQQFGFSQNANNGWQLMCAPALQDTPENWQYDTCRISPEHYLAYCVEAECAANQPVSVWIIPENTSSNLAWKADVAIVDNCC